MRPSGLITEFGEMIPSSRPPRPQGLGQVGWQNTSWDAASYATEETRDWNAWLASPDIENNFARDTIVARIRDLVRNDGWAAGAIARITDGVVGGDMRPIAKPDWRYLSMFDKACDETWAKEFGRQAESLYRSWSTDSGRWCDASRRHTMSQIFRLAFRSKLVDGETIGVSLWIPQRRKRGKARYATAIQLIDTDRLSNPQLEIDTKYRRGGIEIDDYGATVAFHIRQAHMGDWFNAAASVTWDRFERETDFGRPIVLYDSDDDRPGEHRPAGGILKPILGRMKMLARYDSVELQAAVINAVFSAYIESPNDPETVADALGADETDGLNHRWGNYQAARQEFHAKKSLKLSGAVIPTLFPGEKIVGVDGKRPSTNYAAFENACLRNVATATGISAEQISQDWSKTNYSSARASLMEAWKTLKRRRQDFAAGFCSPVYASFLEEAIDRGELPMPKGAPDFIDARSAYSACTWMGPPLGWVDPVKEAQAAVLRMDAGLSTLQDECAAQGLDYEEVIAQRKVEVAAFREAGLVPPTWYGQPAQDVEQEADPRNERALPHLAQRLFNTPIAIHPDKADVIMAALADRLGIARLFHQTAAPMAFDDGYEGEDDRFSRRQRADRGYDMAAGIAVVPICGTLVENGSLRPYSGMTGYDGIRMTVATALEDPDVEAIVLDIDSPGGEVAGCFDLVDTIYRSRGVKPVWAILNEMACSAAYAIASAADRITVPRTGVTGSIGVILMHVDLSRALAADGVTVTIIQYGDRKSDGNETKPLDKAALARFQSDIDTMGDLFTATVARNRGMAVADVRAQQALTYLGAAGVDAGLADAVMAPDEAFAALLATL